MRYLVLIVSSLMFCTILSAKDSTKLFNLIGVEDYEILDRWKVLPQVDTVLSSYDVFTCDEAMLTSILIARPKFFHLTLPLGGDRLVEVELVRSNVFRQDAELKSSSGKTVAMPNIVTYDGKIVGDSNSFVAITIFPNRINCIVSDKEGTYVLGKLNEFRNPSEFYVGYRTSSWKDAIEFHCGVDDGDIENSTKRIKKGPKSNVQSGTGPCKFVNVYVEVTYEIAHDKFGDDVQAMVEYVATLFNLVGAFYRNESIYLEIGALVYWDTNDPYPNNDKDAALSDFEGTGVVPTYGNLAVLLTTNATGNGTGGIGELPTCFDSFCDGWYSYSNLNIAVFGGLPTYTWDVNVVAHEIGHNLNARHTHWCGWSGGAIDGCWTSEIHWHCPWPGFTTCNDGPMPGTNEGRVMSYCHQTNVNVGINFALGLHTQVGDRMREFIEDDEECLWVRSDDWAIQNQEFLNFPFTQLETAHRYLVAGKSVTSGIPDGEVVVRNTTNGDVIFRAGERVYLKDGFKTQSTRYFQASIDQDLIDCSSSSYLRQNMRTVTKKMDNSSATKGPTFPELSVYPNPTDGLVTVEYVIVQECEITVDVVNVYGQFLISIPQGIVTTGKHKLDVNVFQLSKGLYFIRLLANSQILTKELVVR